MKDLKRMLLITAMLCITSIGAFAQEQEQKPQTPKPKPPDIVVQNKNRPAPDNKNQEPKKGDEKKKP